MCKLTHQFGRVAATVSAGRRRKGLRSSNPFADLNLCDDCPDCLPKKRFFHVSSYGQVNGFEILNVSARTRMTNRSWTWKKNPRPISSPNQSRNQTLNQTEMR